MGREEPGVVREVYRGPSGCMEGSEQHCVGLKISWIQDFGVWIVDLRAWGVTF